MLSCMALVRTDVSQERIASAIRETRIRKLGTLAVVFLRTVFRFLVTDNDVLSSPILVTLMMEAMRPSATSALTTPTRRYILEEAIHHIHRRKTSNLTQN
jgi:hypothetical protein